MGVEESSLRLAARASQVRNGSERIQGAGFPDGVTLLEFWQWSMSDLVSNTTRGLLAEFIVGRALGCDLTVREEWGDYDLLTPSGLRVEVKSSAFVQSWHQDALSRPMFGCARKGGWSSQAGRVDKELKRRADVYIFALLAHQDKATINPLDLAQWEFFVVPTRWLDEHLGDQRTISLPVLRSAFTPLHAGELGQAVASSQASPKGMR